MKKNRNNPSPCLRCTLVADPRQCQDKDCQPWRQWFIARWNTLRAYPRQELEAAGDSYLGLAIGGQRYTLPHRVTDYLDNNPCETCLCPKDLCAEPCRIRRDWDKTRNEVFL